MIFPQVFLQGGLLMDNSVCITSNQNPLAKLIHKLRDNKGREQEQLFLIEGYREILRAIESGYPLQTLIIAPDLFLGSQEKALINRAKKTAKVISFSKALFEKCSYRDRPDGLLAIAPIRKKTMEEFFQEISQRRKDKKPFLLIAESIEKPGNLGSMFRSSDAAGVHGILVCDRKTDVFNPNVVRASVGTLFTVPFIECDLKEALRFLKKEGIQLVAATPHAKMLLTEADLTQGVAIAMGTEQIGLTDVLMKEADLQIKIPMHGIADSLNVAAATTLMLYETLRQRYYA